MDDATLYNGKKLDLRQKMTDVVAGMKDCKNFRGLVSIRRFQDALDIRDIPKTQTLDKFLNDRQFATPPIEKIAFHDPFLVCYSSGTTGIPKAIVHSVGGVLLNFMKEARLHEDARSDSISLQYTTTGWIMYLASIGQLLGGGRVVLYDGSPFQPDLQTFIKLVSEQKVTRLGISPRWMHEIAKAGISPRKIADLSNLRMVSSTGMVLSTQLFEWFYDEGFPSHVHLANISGGTDIVSLGDEFETMSCANTLFLGRLLRPGEPSDSSLRCRHTRPISRYQLTAIRLAAAPGPWKRRSRWNTG